MANHEPMTKGRQQQGGRSQIVEQQSEAEIRGQTLRVFLCGDATQAYKLGHDTNRRWAKRARTSIGILALFMFIVSKI